MPAIDRRVLVLILSLLASTFRLSAGPLAFPEHHFSIQIPENWTPISPTPAQTLAALQSPDNSKKLVVIANKLPENERATGLRDFRAGVKDNLAGQGWQFGPEKQVTIRGLSFISLMGHKDTHTLFTYTTAAGDDLYLLTFHLDQNITTSDPEVESIIQSFELLTPASSKSEPTPAVAASRPEPTSAVVTSQAKPLLELESHIQWSAVDDKWKDLRPGWQTATKACSNPKCVAKQLLDLEGHLKWEAVEGGWKKRREGWVGECKSATREAAVAKLLLELEENIGWQAVDEGWKARRDGWIAEIKGR